MTPAEQAARLMPRVEFEVRPSRFVEWDVAGKLWVELGIRRVQFEDETRWEESAPSDRKKIVKQIKRKRDAGFISCRVAKEILDAFQYSICASALTAGEVAGHGAEGEPRTALTSGTDSGGVRAHETPGGDSLSHETTVSLNAHGAAPWHGSILL